MPRLGTERVLGRVRYQLGGTTSNSRAGSDGLEAARGCMSFAEIDAIAVAVLVVILVLIAVFVVLPVLFALVDLLILAVVALLGVVGKVVFRRPWVVEAVTDRGKRHEWRVVGWRRSGERCHEIARQLEAGVIPPPTDGVTPAP